MVKTKDPMKGLLFSLNDIQLTDSDIQVTQEKEQEATVCTRE